ILRGVRQQQDEPGRFSICSRQAAVVLNVPDKTESSKWTYEWVLGMKNGRPRIAYVNQYSGTPNIKKITINGKEQLATLDNPPPSTGNK
ncbi:hypothetical protein NP169_23335, partial [Salmonella enterica]|nr:hypothetical protein [Salmonella enterica]